MKNKIAILGTAMAYLTPVSYARSGIVGDLTRLKDAIVPEVFSEYIDIYTAEKSVLVQSGAMVVDPRLVQDLRGGGATFNRPFFNDLSRVEENISADTGPDAVPNNITTNKEVQVRLSRNQSWGSADLVSNLIGTDPMTHIRNKVGGYWVDRLQAAFIATAKGVFAGNDKPTDSNHVQSDLTYDASGTAFEEGVTQFKATSFVNAILTMGDRMNDLKLMAINSIVYGTMIKNDLIDFVKDSSGVTRIPTYMGRILIVDDSVPFDITTGKFETWLFAQGAFAFANGSPKVATEVTRNPLANNGGGEELLVNRVEWVIHPVGHAYYGKGAPAGGPSNDATSGNLAHADSFERVFPERKQIKIARLITRELEV